MARSPVVAAAGLSALLPPEPERTPVCADGPGPARLAETLAVFRVAGSFVLAPAVRLALGAVFAERTGVVAARNDRFECKLAIRRRKITVVPSNRSCSDIRPTRDRSRRARTYTSRCSLGRSCPHCICSRRAYRSIRGRNGRNRRMDRKWNCSGICNGFGTHGPISFWGKLQQWKRLPISTKKGISVVTVVS